MRKASSAEVVQELSQGGSHRVRKKRAVSIAARRRASSGLGFMVVDKQIEEGSDGLDATFEHVEFEVFVGCVDVVCG